MTYLIVSLVVLTGVTLTGCDSEDPYADAPSATAQQTKQAEQSGSSGAGPLPSGAGEDLPPGHPPVQNSQAPSGATGAAGRASEPTTESGGGSEDGVYADERQGADGASESQADDEGGAHTRGPLRWAIPDGWSSVPPSTQMRLAEYRVPGTQQSNPANLGVFHFGRRGGGDVQSNIERWVGQFSAPDGGQPEANITQNTMSGGQMTIHRVDVSGTYSPGVGMGGGQSHDNRRMLAAIVDSPDGLYFFKLVGPSPTVSEATGQFDALIQSLSYTGG
jgi:hypothetical protein